MSTTTLFRPLGRAELELVEQSGFKRWPPRLPEQPIFYPVTNERYAVEIAEKWNTKDAASGFTGYVTEFEVETEFLSRYDVQCAGAAHHTEYWIPAEDLETFNDHIVGKIRVIRRFEPAS